MSVDERTALSERLSEFFATYAGIACLNRQNPTSLNKVLSQGRTGVLTTSNPHLLSLLAVTLHDADIGQSIPIYIYFANADRLAPTVFQTLADRPFSTFATLRRQNIPKELLEAPIRVTFDAATNGLRLELDLPDIQLGDRPYAFEELIAEIAAAMCCADFGISCTPRPDHAAYVASWLKVLKDDRKAIFTAAAAASAAADYIASFSRRTELDEAA